MEDRLIYEIPPEMTLETSWECSVEGCHSVCWDEAFAREMGCAVHGTVMIKVVRQFEGDRLISEFKERREDDREDNGAV